MVTILVGIATVVAINVFGSAAEQANRDAVRQDLIAASAQAQAIWARPRALGGVQGDFTTDPPGDQEFIRLLGIPGSFQAGDENTPAGISNENAQYDIVRAENQLTITATPVSYENVIILEVQRATSPGDDPWNISIKDGNADAVFLSGSS